MTLSATIAPPELDELCVNTLRFLAVDAVQKAKSGHPGLPLGSAAMAYALWDRLLKFNPRDPFWPDRDRFVLSAGHGCALLYALLHVTGFDLPLEELERFRQWGSRTPGHPEYGKTPGVEATTGPLGQGLANAVGMAIAEVALAARFNRPGHSIVDHYTYVLASDGDLEEGISSEAGSEAGHLRLGKLIVLYADNHITIEGSTELAFTEDRMARFAAFGWHVQRIEQSNDIDAVAAALEAAREERGRPSLIQVRTHIGFGSPHKQDTAAAHGEPLGLEEVRLTKEGLGWPVEPPFHIPEEALEHFREAVARGSTAQAEWELRLEAFAEEHPDLAAEFQRVMHRQLPEGWDANLPTFTSADGPMATRIASGKTIAVLGSRLPEMMGGSADLAPSTHTNMDGAGNFEPENRAGRNMHFGIREHAMGAILNGMALHRGLIPFGGDLPGLQRLHASSDAPGGHERPAGDLCLHPRQHRHGRGRPDPSACRTIAGIAIDPRHGCHPAGGCQRDGCRLADRHRAKGRSRCPGVDSPGTPRARPGPLSGHTRGSAAWGLCPRGLSAGCATRHHSDRDRLRSASGAGGA